MQQASALDLEFLALAQDQAARALYITSPNPRVGCVLVHADGRLLGQGHTQQAGGPHAEIMALRDAAAQGADVRGATAYVTLEPCSHQGRTGPCCDALVQAGVRRVVASLGDPNPLVAGRGFARLRAAGVEVLTLPPGAPLGRASRQLNIGFFSRMVRKTPWVRMKIAASLDGKTALSNGASQWITSPEARADGHAWRARACAVLTGIGTVLADRPRLDVRLVSTPRQPHVVVLDSHLRTPPDAPLLLPGRSTLLYCTEAAAASAPAQALAAVGGLALPLPPAAPGSPAASAMPGGTGPAPTRLDLAALLQDLGRREINELHVEAGHTLNGALLQARLVDEVLVYLAPKLLGLGRGMASWGPLSTLDDAVPLVWQEHASVGPDLRLRAVVTGRDTF